MVARVVSLGRKVSPSQYMHRLTVQHEYMDGKTIYRHSADAEYD
jgi:hypothetical protein